MSITTIYGATLSVFLYGQSKNWGEEFFVGALTSLFFGIIIWIYNRNKTKKEIENTTRQVQQDIAKEARLNTVLFSSKEFDFDYSHLYGELVNKCNPSNYMNPYDPKKVEISNSIYSQLKENQNNISELIKLRNRAIKELNIEFSAKELFEKLSLIFNPSNYINENYDATKLYAANKIYAQIQDFKDNIIELERIVSENKINILSTSKQTKEDIVLETKDTEEVINDNTQVKIPIAIIAVLIIGVVFVLMAISSLTQLEKDYNTVSHIYDDIEKAKFQNNGFISQFSSDKFSITYPSTWEKVQQNVDTGTKTTISIQIMEKRKDDYSFSPNINIIVSKDKRTESTDYLAEISHKQLTNANIDCDLIGIYNRSLGGYNGSLLKQTLVLKGFKILQYQYIIKKMDNTTFIITASMDYNNYEIQETTIDEILSSLIIK